MTSSPEYGVPQAHLTREETTAKTFAVSSLVLGILAVLLAPTAIVGLVVSVVGLALASRARKHVSYKLGMANAGLVLCIIGLVLGTLATLAWIGVTFFGVQWFQDNMNWLPRQGAGT